MSTEAQELGKNSLREYMRTARIENNGEWSGERESPLEKADLTFHEKSAIMAR